MDIQRPSNARAKKIRRIVYAAVALLSVAGVSYGLSKLKPAAPSVDRSTIWPDEVKRGPMVREVRGLGTLVPLDIRWIPAQTAARVERICGPGRTTSLSTRAAVCAGKDRGPPRSADPQPQYSHPGIERPDPE